jgi:hypothetical protein
MIIKNMEALDRCIRLMVTHGIEGAVRVEVELIHPTSGELTAVHLSMVFDMGDEQDGKRRILLADLGTDDVWAAFNVDREGMDKFSVPLGVGLAFGRMNKLMGEIEYKRELSKDTGIPAIFIKEALKAYYKKVDKVKELEEALGIALKKADGYTPSSIIMDEPDGDNVADGANAAVYTPTFKTLGDALGRTDEAIDETGSILSVEYDPAYQKLYLVKSAGKVELEVPPEYGVLLEFPQKHVMSAVIDNYKPGDGEELFWIIKQ